MEVDLSRKMVSILAACKLLGVTRRTVYNWMSTGKIEYIRTPGGAVRIFADTLFRECEFENESLKQLRQNRNGSADRLRQPTAKSNRTSGAV